MSIEVTTHNILRDLLRHQPGIVNWNHHLTMARLVARAFRLSKSSLIQTGIATHRLEGKYRLSYLIPALLWHESVTIAIPSAFQDRLITAELPQLQQWLGTSKQVYGGDTPPVSDFNGLWIIDPQSWLQLQLDRSELLPSNPVILDGADDLENCAQALLTIRLNAEDWDSLRLSQPSAIWEQIVELKIQLMAALWQRPLNPYNCYLLDDADRSLIESLKQLLIFRVPPNWQNFDRELSHIDRLVWAQIDRTRGTFTLAITPTDLVAELAPIWERQPSILITSAVDLTAKAIGYRQELGLSEVTSIKFPLDLQKDSLKLYIPRWMPMPNTSKFQVVLVDEIKHLLYLTNSSPKFVVILIQDTPLQAQLAAILAAEWGTRVQVEQTDLNEANILVSGWEFWRQQQDNLPTPELMIIATLPIPSLEDPLVAAKVGFYKQQRQDWFRLYLLPTGLRILHRAIAPMRSSQGIVAIFDNRIDRRIYGQQVLASLNPMVRINYSDLVRSIAFTSL
ncbi:ATP-dependent DNA helicase [Chamaesiphon sp. VAR_48_metabat_135_sub]|uniref:ATP-dependent DNA helicase n=1 Tax=Chamaesiphon sp. VAR_48_metabat_135_sub TaxID=2964699 RepID=UPI00286A0B54|nr:ATP-dependent DNA helicase [Chamaesiphon sp. VAR_48_metabat_135_sub]